MAANLGTAWIQVKPSMNGVRGSILSGLRGTGSQFSDQMGGEVQKSKGMTVGMAAVWGAASAVALKAIDTISTSITASIDSAIKRVDTLNNSSRTFANMGFDANTSAKAVKNLEKSIQGLPTPLDSALRGMTALAATYSDVGLGQKVFTGLNNAILGFGGTAEMVDNAIMQLSQLPMDGPLDAQTWNSLRNSGLTPVLVAMAKESGTSVSEMKKAFGEGELTVQDFTNRLINMNENGGGGLKSLEQIAKDSTKGIGTSMTNAQTAIARGVASIITALGSEKIAGAVTGAGKAMETALKAVAAGITALPKVIENVTSTLQGMVNFVKENAVAFGAFGVALGAILTPLALAAAQAAILDLRIRAMLAWDAVMKVIKGTQAAFLLLNAAMRANPILSIVAIIGVLVGAFALLWKNNEGFRNFFISAWEQIKSTFGDVMGGIISAFDTVSQKVSEFITGGLNALSTAFQAVSGWIHEHATLLTNIGIVIGTLVLPMLMKLTVQFIKVAAQAVASAARAAGAWVVSTAKMAAQFAVTAAKSTAHAVVAGAAWVKQSAIAFVGWLRALPKLVAQFAVASASAVKNAAIAAGAWVAQAARTTVAWAGVFVKYLAGVAMAGVQTLLAGAKMAAGWLLAMGPIGLIVAAVAGAVALIIANWDTVKNAVGAVWAWIQGAVNNVINWIKANWPLLLGILMGPIGLAVAWIIQNFDKVKAFIAGVWNGIKSGASAAWGAIRGVFSGVAGWFGSMFRGALNAVTGVWNGIGSFFRGIPQKIKDAFGDLASIGRFIVQGIANGLNPTNVVNKMKELASSALSTVKNFLGIKSPSRVMRDQVGKQITAGLGLGITRNTKTAVNAAVDSSEAILAAYSKKASIGVSLTPNASLAEYAAERSTLATATAVNSQNQRPNHIENVNIASDYDADRLLQLMGIKQSRYEKGVM